MPRATDHDVSASEPPRATPAEAQATQEMAAAAGPEFACRSCAAPLDALQRYCLHCGSPIPGAAPSLDSALAAAVPAAAASTTTVATRRITRPTAALGVAGAAGALLLAVLLGALIAGDDDPRPQPVRVNVPAAKAPVVNVAAPAAGAPAAEAAFVSDWPDKDGWTVRLQALPKAGTMPSAVTAAKSAATTGGAKDVGALDSDEYSSLDGRQYVIYSGVFRTKRQATRALRGLKRRFPDAAVVRVASGGRARTASRNELGDLQSRSGDDYVRRSKRLPDRVRSQGRPPPRDDAAPGAGDTAEEIG